MQGWRFVKKAFTMIELIFVIVIIGILASVAISRLAATRDDARVSVCMNDIATFMIDISAFYTTRGDFIDPLTGTVVPESITDVDFIPTPTIDSDGDNGNFQFACGDISTPTAIVVFTTAKVSHAGGESSIRMTATTQTPLNIVDTGLASLLQKKNIASPAGIEHFIGGIRTKR